MARLKALWDGIRDSLWFLPSLITLGFAGLAVLALLLDRQALHDVERRELWFLFGGGVEGARGVLDSIAGSIITVTGVVFSVTIVALQLASTQFTPRVLRQFMADRANQTVLGVFIGTFTYTLLVLRTVRSGNDDFEEFVPALSVTGAAVFALVSIGFLIFFIDHLARSIQADHIIQRVTHDTLHVLERLERDHADSTRDANSGDVPDDPPAVLRSQRSGYVEHVEQETLLRHAGEHRLVVRIEKRIGEFVVEGEPLLSVWPADELDEKLERGVRGGIVIGPARTPHQDVELGLVELVDIAVKALSPSINDPTTAMTAVDRIAEVLVALGRRPGRDTRVTTGANGARLILPRFDFDRAAEVAIEQIRHFGAANPALAIKLLNTIGDIAALLPEDRRRPLLRHLDTVRRHGEQVIEQPDDRRRVVAAADNALARAAAPLSRDEEA